MILFFLPQIVFATMSSDALLGDYQLTSGGSECASSITIDQRVDWEGESFIGLNENRTGRGLQCSFKNIDAGEKLEEGICPTAGPVDPNCVEVTREQSAWRGGALFSDYQMTQSYNGQLIFRRTSSCSVTKKENGLVYVKTSGVWELGGEATTKTRVCNYK